VNCPHCGSTRRQAVKETRRTSDERIIRRRRCPDCFHDFGTVEQLSSNEMRVRKSDGRIVPFSREQIRRSVVKASVRPYHADRLDSLIDGVVSDLYGESRIRPVETNEIGEAVLRHLKEVDEVTQIRFALVHAGRLDRLHREDGWTDARDVRRWLRAQYPEVEHKRPPGRLTRVVKRDGRREPYSRSKLERSIGVASKGRGNTAEVRRLATDVAADVEAELDDQPLVTSGQLASEILRLLRRRDHIAFLRYASTAKGYVSPDDYDSEAASLRARFPHE
jgi:transcriptional repressor NrdR